MFSESPPVRRKAGFTLVELLVVVAVVAVLMALLFPVVGRVQVSAKRTQCANNLRQIGIALQSYLGENNMVLPHCWVSVPCNPLTRDPDEFGPISGHLAKYLGHEDVPWHTKVFVPQFQCPAYPVQLSEQEALATPTHITYRLVLGKAGQPNPFGGLVGGEPISLLNVKEATGHSPATLPVLFDMDQGIPLPSANAPETPVHGGRRNVLYLDGHVAFEADTDFLEDFR